MIHRATATPVVVWAVAPAGVAAGAVIGSWYTEINVDDEFRAPTPDLAPPTHRQRHMIMAVGGLRGAKGAYQRMIV